ncbi:uncharacterized protein [Epargyreus clarus]|uniref:uncharacterized protein n=1 Tax=Epargyreus clarus TaxID=520877 RepID=UPI003C3023FF
MSFIKKIVLLICIFWCVNAEFEEGDICDFDDERGLMGTCKILHTCDYAVKRLQMDRKHVPTCSYKGRTPVVCCPENNFLHEPGILSRDFLGTTNGVITNNNLERRYDGIAHE